MADFPSEPRRAKEEVVETSGGDEWWRQVVGTSCGDELWGQVVAAQRQGRRRRRSLPLASALCLCANVAGALAEEAVVAGASGRRFYQELFVQLLGLLS